MIDAVLRDYRHGQQEHPSSTEEDDLQQDLDSFRGALGFSSRRARVGQDREGRYLWVNRAFLL